MCGEMLTKYTKYFSMLVLKGDHRALQRPSEDWERAKMIFNIIADRVERDTLSGEKDAAQF